MSPATQQSILNTNRTFEQAVIDRNLQALDSVYTADARILPPGGEMIGGRENIKQFWGAALDGMNVRSVTLQTVDFEVVGDTGYEIGRATLESASEGATPDERQVRRGLEGRRRRLEMARRYLERERIALFVSTRVHSWLKLLPPLR